MDNNKFNFYVDVDIPDDIYKATYEVVGEDKYKNMVIEGVASDNSVDADNQILEPSGYDIKDFLKSGLLNLEHFTTRKGDSQYWIGEPIDAKVKGNEFWVKGKLWEKHPLARNFWDTLLIMKASGSKRRPGFSIEGKTLEKDKENKNRITKAKISHCAITFSPKNKNSWFDIVKGEQTEDYIKPEVEEIKSSKYVYEFMKGEKCYGVTKSFEIEEKEDEETEKSVTTESAAPLKKEDLKKKTINATNAMPLIKAMVNGKISPRKTLFLIKSFNKR